MKESTVSNVTGQLLSVWLGMARLAFLLAPFRCRLSHRMSPAVTTDLVPMPRLSRHLLSNKVLLHAIVKLLQ